MSQIDVKDASGVTQTIAAVDNTGQVAAADSLPVVIASDQSAVPVSAAALPLPSGAATAAKQPALGTAGTASADVITVQGVASMTPVLTDGSATTQPISATSLPLPTGAASESTLAAQGTLIGAVNETAPASDTASSGLNGRLQRIAQNLTTFFGVKVTAITALATGGSGVIGWLSQIWNELQTRLPATLGIKTAANSLSVAPASDGVFQVSGSTGTPTSISGSITTGGTAQNAASSNSTRKGYLLQNLSSGDLWFSTLATAVADQPSIKLPAGAYFESPLGAAGTGAISIIGATTGQAWAGREW